MADQKISELTALTGANVADDDAIAIVDTSATETKKIVFSELKNALDTATGFVRITGDTMTGALDVQSTITSDGLTVDGNVAIGLASTNTWSTGYAIEVGTEQAAIWGAGDQIDITGNAYFNSGWKAAATKAGASKYEQALGSHNFAVSGSVTADSAITFNQALNIANNGDISFYEDTGSTPKFFWDASAESLQLGGTANIQAQGSNVTTFGNNFVLDGGYKYLTSGAANMLYFDANGNTMFFKASSGTAGNTVSFSETMRIDSSGNVGIGNTSSGYVFTSGETRLAVGDGSEHAAIQIYSGTAKWGGLEFADDATNGTGQGRIGYYHPSNYMQFDTSGSECMRLDASGNLIVGGTSAAGVTSGGVFYATPSSGIYAAANADNAGYFNRNGGDGSIVEFRAGNAPVGSIGVENGDLNIDGPASHSGLRFQAGSIMPRLNGADSSGTIDLGYNDGVTTYAFKNLTLSGGVYLGGTGSANKLDDYEEGTWTPTLFGASSNPTVTYSVQSGYYTKVGNVVNLFCRVQISARSGGTGTALIAGLPFAHHSAARAGGGLGYCSSVNLNTGYTQIGVSGDANSSTIRLVQSGDNVGASVIDVSNTGSTFDILFTYTYQTT